MTQQTEHPDISAQLLEVKKLLGRSYRQKLADETGFSTRRVSQVFEDLDVNHEIIQKAIAMATEAKEKQESVTASLAKL